MKNTSCHYCERCGSEKIIKNGHSPDGYQLYHCKSCGHYFADKSRYVGTTSRKTRFMTSQPPQNHLEKLKAIYANSSLPKLRNDTAETLSILSRILQWVLASIGLILALCLSLDGGLNIIGGFIVLISAFVVSPFCDLIPGVKKITLLLRVSVQFLVAFLFLVLGFSICFAKSPITSEELTFLAESVEYTIETTTPFIGTTEQETVEPYTEEESIAETEITTMPETDIETTYIVETEAAETPIPVYTIPKHEYWINTDSGKFHSSSCHTIKNKSDPHWTTTTDSYDNLKNQGYDPCNVCLK